MNVVKKKSAKAPASASLLVELRTEELPPKSLRSIGEVFAEQVVAEIIQHRLKDRVPSKRVFATPRRLAVLIEDVRAQGLDSEHEGPVSSNSRAVEGFAKSYNVAPELLERRQTSKGEIVVAKMPGVKLDAVLPSIVEKVTKRLPVSKVMRWGDGEAQFARPVHGLVMMHGSRVVPGSVLGVTSGGTTLGHRFMSTGSIRLGKADEYEVKLRRDGHVIADFAARRSEIDRQLQAEAKRQKASLGEYQDLLDEVTALTEFPAVYAGTFDTAFLEVPQECLILTMRQNQKYFPLFDADGTLLPKFLIVSNLRATDPRLIVAGNERVVRPRFEDARFFYKQDRKLRLEARVPTLARMVYHNKLGSQLERVQRIKLLAGEIARLLGADVLQSERAAELCKADLVSGMVGEFPELQGVMGRYYALNDGESREVADAIEAHYRPRFAGDKVPSGAIACSVALADKLDTLAGLFSIREQPTGDRDPFGLRRAALGLIRIVVENSLSLSIQDLSNRAFERYSSKLPEELVEFVYDRFAGYLKDLGFSTLQVDAVLSKNRTQPSLVPKQLEAVKAFQALPEAESLAAANKRVVNILKQAEAKGDSFANAELGDLREPAERALHDAIRSASEKARVLFDRGDYTGYLTTFSVLKSPVDAFFDSVMVMVDDPTLRRGRLALLRDLREAMNRVADISKLAA